MVFNVVKFISLIFYRSIFQKGKSTSNFYTKFVFDLFRLDSGWSPLKIRFLIYFETCGLLQHIGKIDRPPEVVIFWYITSFCFRDILNLSALYDIE